MIKTKRIYDPKEDSDGTRILITRKWPRGQKKDRFDEWIKDLSPEEDTLNKWEDSKRAVFSTLIRKKLIPEFIHKISQKVAKLLNSF